MPSLLLHLTAVERLAADSGSLPPGIARALDEDIEYARFGACLPDLPNYSGLWGGVAAILKPREPPRYARLFHDRAPVGMGLKMAELVSMGALVGAAPGLAFLCGYFTHLCLDRVLHPAVDRLAELHREPQESLRHAHRRIEWMQGLFYLEDQQGSDLMGSPLLMSHFQVLKRQGLPTGGIGRGLYELIRVAAQESLGEAPAKAEVDAWVRNLYLFGKVLSSPVGRAFSLPAYANLSRRELYRSDHVDLPGEVSRALELTRKVLHRLSEYIGRTTFTRRARARFFAELPEGSISGRSA